eukprot:m.285503 g.285503  ORF g.285503 m.285503 type:complete len:283 (+) comp40685_c0_seq4:809-1657(+)
MLTSLLAGSRDSERHPGLVLKTSEALSRARLAVTKRSTLNNYFDLLESVLQENEIFNEPSRIFNFDETGMPLQSRPPKVLVKKGQKHAFAVSSGDKTQITVLVCACASGYALPPHIIFKQSFGWSQQITAGEVPDTRYSVTPTGWSNSTVFEGWFFDVFLNYAPAARPVVLIVDGHSSHYNPAVLRAAAEQDVIIFCLPPNTTHLAQPLDRCAFSSLKSHWTSACHNFTIKSRGRFVTRSTFCSVFAEAWYSSMSVKNVTTSFKVTGIYPFNRNAISLAEDA